MSPTPDTASSLDASALTPKAGDALVVVDVQYDFLPGGALGVPDGNAVLPALNGYIRRFATAGLPIFFSRDWHPSNHCSFHEQGGPWPPHCVAGSEGAAFADGLHVPEDVIVISKATAAHADAYSAFQGTILADRLRDLGCRRLFVGGLATDYCVLATVRDAVHEGFAVVVLCDAIRAVNLNPGDGQRAEDEMRRAGAALATTGSLRGSTT